MTSINSACIELRKKVPPDWAVQSLGSVTDFQEGPGILAKDFREAGVPLLRLRNIQTPKVKLAGCNYLDPEMVALKWSHFKLQEGDLLISTSASLGRVSVVGPESIGTIPYTGIIRFRSCNEQLHHEYLRAFLSSRSFIEQAEKMATGSVIRHFGPTHLKQMAITLPSLGEQVQIANIFDALDHRIGSLIEVNKTLEAIALSIYKSWFIDFDPVHEKQQGRYCEGIDAETAKLFPNTFEDSSLGAIPNGWRVGTVGSEFVLTMGQSPPGDTYNTSSDGMPFYQGRTDFGYRFPTVRVFCSSPSRIAKNGDILVSVRAPVGDVNVAIEDCCLGRGVAGIRHPKDFQSYALYSITSLSSHLKKFDGEGTVFGSINKKDFESIPFVVASNNIIEKFEDVASTIDKKIVNNESKIRTLSKLRDTLLPRLISGQVRIKDAALMIEGVI